MEWLIVGFGLVFGGITGLFVSLLFFRNDIQWKNFMTMAIGIGADLALLPFSFIVFDITDKKEKMLLGFSLFLSMLIVFCIMTKVMSILLKDQTGKNVLRMMDLFLGFKNSLNDYYESRKKDVDADIEKSLKELNEREIMLSFIEKENYSKEIELNNLKKIIDSSISEVIAISIPVNKRLAIDKSFIDDCRIYLDDYRKFKNQFLISTDNIINSLEKDLNDKNKDKNETKKLQFDSFLTSLSQAIVTYLFDDSSNVRVHFRVLVNNEYHKYFIYKKDEVPNYRTMTPIPINERNLITTSFVHRCPITKALNLEYNFDTNKDNPYSNYLSIAFYKITKKVKIPIKYENDILEEVPLLSMTISIKDQNKYDRRLNMLLLTRFDREIHEKLEKMFKKFNIDDIFDII